eukprot:4976963-Alexandrium_andersonii.AAC.1
MEHGRTEQPYLASGYRALTPCNNHCRLVQRFAVRPPGVPGGATAPPEHPQKCFRRALEAYCLFGWEQAGNQQQGRKQTEHGRCLKRGWPREDEPPLWIGRRS